MPRREDIQTIEVLREIWRESKIREVDFTHLPVSDHSEVCVLIAREKQRQQALLSAIRALEERQ